MITLLYRRFFMLLLLVLLVGGNVPHAALAQASSPQDEENTPKPAKVSVIIHAEPSIQVTPSGIITYTISIRNTGERFASMVRVWIDYDPNVLTILDTSFERESDWVSESSPGHIRLEYAGGVGEDKTHSAFMRVQVADHVAMGTIINMWAGYEWVDGERYAPDNSSNAAPVLVGETNLTSSWVWMDSEVFDGKEGPTFSFYSDRFVPGEKIEVWLNSFGYIRRKRSLDTQTDGHGRFWIHYPASDSNLSRGFHQIIVRGERSKLVAGKVFLVR